MIHRTLFTVLRVFWFICGLFLWAYWLVSVPVYLQRAAQNTLPPVFVNGISSVQLVVAGTASWGVSVAQWAWIDTAVNGLTFLVFSIIALLIWWRVHTWFGLLTAYVLLLAGSAYMSMAIQSAELSETAVAIWELGALIWPLFFLWLYLFPNGRAVPRRLLWVFVPLLSLFSFLFVLNSLTIFINDNLLLISAVAALGSVASFLILPLLIIAIGAQIYRYIKLSNSSERKQTKWFLFGLLIVFVPTTLLGLFTEYPAELDTITFMALPIGIGISILRYRLWDIDVIIRKTVQYVVLTAVLALIYFGTVILLQTLVGQATGEQSPLVIVLSTLLIAALFSPLRRRIQDIIDRRFFRKKYDAQQVLAHFAQTARDETDIEMLTAVLIDVIQETIQPEQIGLWLKKE
ncbi:MAG: hypothetical protein HC804_01305 [Anaerolineae bacterium]|nr:hypothetical protein [Anaerolineae bacterium]